ncbi:MAG: hypothetical protein LAO31_00885 [Acidobacteriia bacterium]|nr:hypothetical protein [Terriglobia bacterium]
MVLVSLLSCATISDCRVSGGQAPSSKASSSTPVQKKEGQNAPLKEDPFAFLPPVERNVAALSYSTILSDVADTRALGMMELADLISRKYPQRSIPFYRMAFEFSQDMTEREYPSVGMPAQQNWESFKSWQRGVIREMSHASKTQVQASIAESLFPLDPKLAESLFWQIQPALPEARRFPVNDQANLASSSRVRFYKDPDAYYAAAQTLVMSKMNTSPEEAMGIASRVFPHDDYLRFKYLFGWTQKLHQMKSDLARYWIADAFESLKSIQLPPPNIFALDEFSTNPVDQRGLLGLIPFTASNYPEMIPVMILGVLEFSARLEHCEDQIAELKTMHPSSLQTLRSHSLTLELLARLQTAVQGKDDAWSKRIAERIEEIPKALPGESEKNSWPGYPDATAYVQFNHLVDEKGGATAAAKLLPQIQDPQMKFDAVMSLANVLRKDHPEEALSRLKEAEDLLDEIHVVELPGGKIDLSIAEFRLQSESWILQSYAAMNSEKVSLWLKRFLQEFADIDPKDPEAAKTENVQSYYLEAITWIAKKNPDEAIQRAKEIKDTRQRVQAFNRILQLMLSAGSSKRE